MALGQYVVSFNPFPMLGCAMLSSIRWPFMHSGWHSKTALLIGHSPVAHRHPSMRLPPIGPDSPPRGLSGYPPIPLRCLLTPRFNFGRNHRCFWQSPPWQPRVPVDISGFQWSRLPPVGGGPLSGYYWISGSLRGAPECLRGLLSNMGVLRDIG